MRWKKEEPNVPFERAYWVVPEKLMAGCYPGSPKPETARQKCRKLLECGIRCFVNLMEPHEADYTGKAFAAYKDTLQQIALEMNVDIAFIRFPIKDLWIPNRADMGRILDYIDASIRNAKPVYIHCWGGRGRTGTVVGCYLARHGLAADHRVLRMIRDLRKNVEDAHLASPETNQQIDMVLSWVAGE